MRVTCVFVGSLRAWFGGAMAAAGAVVVALMAPATADALVVTVAMPDTVTVGQTGLTAQVTLTNDTSTTLPARVCNATECKPPSEGIILIGSCASAGAAPACFAPDPGVFTFAPTATIPLGSA